MITALLAALTLTAAPADSPHREELVLVRIEPTRMVARNLGREDRLLLFANADRTKLVSHRLTPGASLRLDYPRRALDGAWIEVLDAEGEHWSTTGALRLTNRQPGNAWTLFCAPPAAEALMHGPADQGREQLAAKGSLLPAKAQPFFQARALLQVERSTPTHVPGPKPTPPTPEDVPPELEKDPLPPL